MTSVDNSLLMLIINNHLKLTFNFRLKTRKQRLKDSKKIALNHYLDTTVYIRSTNETSSAQTPLTKEEPELSCSAASAAPVPSAGSEVSESTTAMNEEKCESEVTANSSVASVTDVETSEKEEAEPVPCGAQQIGSPLLSYGKEESLPQIDIRNFNVLKAIIRQFKQSQSPTRSEEVFLFNLFTVSIKSISKNTT